MANHNELGKDGEFFAQQYLEKNGYKIRHVNWRTGKLEIDIVAEKDNLLVIVEVKTRSTSFWNDPSQAVDAKKIKNLVNATHYYILENNLNLDVRFDVISLIPEKESYKIEHIENAFIPPIN